MDSGDPYADRSVPPPGFSETPSVPAWTRSSEPADGSRPDPSEPRARSEHGRRFITGLVGLVSIALIALVAVLVLGSSSKSIAASMNLQPSDLPGWQVDGKPTAGLKTSLVGGGTAKSQLSSCIGAQMMRELSQQDPGEVNAGSPLYILHLATGNGGEEAASAVSVERSSSVVISDFDRVEPLLSSQRLLSCEGTLMNDEVGTKPGETITSSGTQVTRIQAPATSAEEAFGLQTTAEITINSIQLQTTVNSYEFGVGRAEIQLTTWGINDAFPDASAEQLANLLVNRAIAKLRD